MLTNELSFIYGVLLGDGWFQINEETRSHQFRLKSIDLDFIESVNEKIFTLTGRRGNIHIVKDNGRFGKKPQWLLIYCDKEFVTQLFQETVDKTQIPSDIFVAPNEQKFWFLRGLMDSEGWCSKNKLGYYQIGIAMTNKNIMENLSKITLPLGLVVGKTGEKLYPSGKTLYTLIFRKPNLDLFTIKRKQKRFRDYRLNILHESQDNDIVRTA